jgi:hypothetical protein
MKETDFEILVYCTFVVSMNTKYLQYAVSLSMQVDKYMHLPNSLTVGYILCLYLVHSSNFLLSAGRKM